MSPIAKTRTIVYVRSDISDVEVEEPQAGRIVIRQHPNIERQCQIDIVPDDVKELKLRDDLVVAVLHLPGEPPKDLVMPIAEFRKTVPDAAVEKGKGVQGRAPGANGYR